MNGPTRFFFAAGVLALVVAAVLHLLVKMGWAGYWVAATHLMLFGWITAMILGVSYHTMPVFTGRDFPYPHLTLAHCVTFGLGVVLATVGLSGYTSVLIVAGMGLQVVGALCFVANALLLVKRGVPRAHKHPVPPLAGQGEVDRVCSWATRAAALALPLALLLLLAMYAGGIGATWLLAAEHLAVLGWVMLMIVGVAGHVLPRFSGQATRGPTWFRAQLGTHLVALLLMIPALGFGWGTLFMVGAAMMTGALVLFAWAIWPTLVVLDAQPRPLPLVFKERPQ